MIDSWRDLGFDPEEALSDKYFVNGASKIVNDQRLTGASGLLGRAQCIIHGTYRVSASLVGTCSCYS